MTMKEVQDHIYVVVNHARLQKKKSKRNKTSAEAERKNLDTAGEAKECALRKRYYQAREPYTKSRKDVV